MDIFKYILPIIIGVILDVLIGAARNIPSFAGLVKLLVDKLTVVIKKDGFDRRKKPIQKSEKATELYLQGITVTITTIIVATIIPSLIVYFAYWINSWLGVIIEGVACFLILGIKRLDTDSMFVYDAIIDDDIDTARHELSFLTNRNVRALSEEGVVRCAVESSAEKLTATIIAPLFFMCFGCSWLAFLYMSIYIVYDRIGFKASENKYYGRFASALYGVFAVMPSFVSGFLVCVSAALVKLDSKYAFMIWKRDRKKLKGEYFGNSVAAVSGALDVQLGGPIRYGDESIKRAFVGDAQRPVAEDDIRNVNKLMYCSMILMLILVCIFRALLYILI